MRIPHDRRRWISIGAFAAGIALLTGCPQAAQPASFTAGAGGSDFGQIDNGKGTTFQVTQIGDGFGITSNGVAGNAVYEVDADGRLTHIQTDLVTADFTYNDDGSATVVGSIQIGTESKSFDGTIPAGTAKVRSRSAGSGSLCRAADFFCTNLDAVLLYVEAALLRNAGYQDNPNNDFEINLANGLIQFAVDQAMAKVIGPAQAFCEAWPEIRGELGDLCD